MEHIHHVDFSWGKSMLGLEKEGDLKRINEFYLHSSPIFLLFLILYGCISPLH